MKNCIKKTLSIIIAAAIFLPLLPVLASAVDVWDGSVAASIPENGTGSYYISTPAELRLLAKTVNGGETYQGASFYLQNDIYLNDASLSGSDLNQWTPIGTPDNTFHGRFYGGDHTIFGLYIDSTENYVGLFGYLDNTSVYDLSVTGAVKGAAFVGGIAGYAAQVDFKNCINFASVSGTGNKTGGIAGCGNLFTLCKNSGAISGGSRVGGICGDVAPTGGFMLFGCDNSGSISGTDRVGGILGNGLSSSSVSSVVQCANSGTVTASGNYCGGILGYAYSSYVSDCLNTAALTAKKYCGGAVGYLSIGGFIDHCLSFPDTDPTATEFASAIVGGYYSGEDYSAVPTADCYYTCGDSFSPANPHGTRLSSQAAESADSYDGFDFINIWAAPSAAAVPKPVVFVSASLGGTSSVWDGAASDGFAGGTGSEQTPYLIETAAQLKYFADSVNSGRMSYKDKYVSLDADINLNDNSVALWTLNATPWAPVGTRLQPFEGSFYGGGHTVSGVYVPYSQKNAYSGFFGNCTGSITDLKIERSYICGVGNTGAVAGYAAAVSDCGVFDTAVAALSVNIGGVAGSAASVALCEADANVNGGSCVGGIVGKTDFGSSVSLCKSSGCVRGVSNIGGICGSADSCALFENCLVSGKIAAASSAGGICGFAEGFTPKYCISSAAFTPDSLGGICGNGTAAPDCRYLGEALSGFSGIALTDTQMRQRTSFEGFDFNTVWMLGVEPLQPYPTLCAFSDYYPLKGSVSLSGRAKEGFSVRIDFSSEVADNATVSYKWFLDGVLVENETGVNFSPVAADAGKALTACVVGTGYCVGALVSESMTVEKADEVRIPSAPTLTSKTDTTVTLAPVEGCEFSLNGGAWQADNIFENLTSNTAYSVRCRIAETATHLAGAAGAALNVTTERSVRPAPPAPILREKTASSVTLEAQEGIEYRLGDSAWQADGVFSGLTENTQYVFYARYKQTDRYFASAASTGLTVTTYAVAVSEISLDFESLLIYYKGEKQSLTPTVLPENATNKEVRFKSSDTSVVAVDELTGELTAIKHGEAVIIATTVDGALTAECVVTVKLYWWQWIIRILLLGFLWY